MSSPVCECLLGTLGALLWQPSSRLVEQLFGKPVELGPVPHREQDSWQAGGCGCLTPGWYLSHQGGAPVVPHIAEARQGLMGGVGSGCPTHGWGSTEPEGQWVQGEGQVSQQAVGLAPVWGPVQTGGGDPGGCGSGGTAKGRVFWRGVASAAKGWVSHCVWVWNRAMAWHSPGSGELGRMEQWLCRPTGQGFGRRAVLISDHGVVKPSTI
jgi:hypothetical protein